MVISRFSRVITGCPLDIRFACLTRSIRISTATEGRALPTCLNSEDQ